VHLTVPDSETASIAAARADLLEAGSILSLDVVAGGALACDVELASST
jgi:hypothetical protein